MAHTDPSSSTQITHGETGGDQLSQVPALDPPNLPFIPTPSNLADVRPSTGRTSITHVEHGDDEQLLVSEPTSQDAASSTSNVTHQAPELISTLSQDQQQPDQQPSTPSIQPQPVSQTVPQTPQTYLTFLLISGRRRTMSFEPESPIGRVKELAWNSWPAGQYLPPSIHSIASLTMIVSGIFNFVISEWQDERPPAPSYLRVLYLGKMLQDDETLISEYLCNCLFPFRSVTLPSLSSLFWHRLTSLPHKNRSKAPHAYTPVSGLIIVWPGSDNNAPIYPTLSAS